jgi:hypothetical protein
MSEIIPNEIDWRGYEKDLDVKYLYNLFFGKSIDEVLCYFENSHSIERMDELLFAPRKVFQYYVLAFARYVLSEKAVGDSDSASSFFTLLKAREKRDSGSVKEIFDSLLKTVNFIANNQEYYDADISIYGDFKERAQEIRSMFF